MFYTYFRRGEYPHSGIPRTWDHLDIVTSKTVEEIRDDFRKFAKPKHRRRPLTLRERTTELHHGPHVLHTVYYLLKKPFKDTDIGYYVIQNIQYSIEELVREKKNKKEIRALLKGKPEYEEIEEDEELSLIVISASPTWGASRVLRRYAKRHQKP